MIELVLSSILIVSILLAPVCVTVYILVKLVLVGVRKASEVTYSQPYIVRDIPDIKEVSEYKERRERL